uniref:Uncharacterized protein n=1 Tax=Leersia perrieri TaxID=77586 RepID=A0A0D9VHP7_9ORYZ
MWMNDVASLVRQGLRWRRRRTARVVDESALQAEGGGGGEAVVATASVGAALARALLALACTVRFDGGEGSTEEAWAAASAWRPRADEVSHLMVRDSMRYAIYA